MFSMLNCVATALPASNTEACRKETKPKGVVISFGRWRYSTGTASICPDNGAGCNEMQRLSCRGSRICWNDEGRDVFSTCNPGCVPAVHDTLVDVPAFSHRLSGSHCHAASRAAASRSEQLCQPTLQPDPLKNPNIPAPKKPEL